MRNHFFPDFLKNLLTKEKKYDIIILGGLEMKKSLITKETPEERKKRLSNGFKPRPNIIPTKKNKLKSRKEKHKKNYKNFEIF